MSELALEMRGIIKDFPGTRAVDDVSLEVRPGEIHALVGQNGAGKTTLIKVLMGVFRKDHGEILLGGERIEVGGPHHAQMLGLSCVHQELNLVPYFSVVENVYLGLKYPHTRLGLIDWSRMAKKTKELLGQLGLEIDPRALARDLSTAQKWMVAICRALFLDARVLILDEPTAALTMDEVETLFSTLARLKERGVAILYVSHRLEEIFRIADRVTVMKDGKHVATVPVAEIDLSSLITLIVGKELKQLYPKGETARGSKLLEVRDLTCHGTVEGISFDLYRGEILGFAGLVGSGRTETARLIFGADARDHGEILLDGRPLRLGSPEDAIDAGIALVPEDRREHGLIVNFPIYANVTLANLFSCRRWPRVGIIDRGKERQAARQFIGSLHIVCTGPDQSVNFLSGGNQQKVVIAKGLFHRANVLLFDEPTQGVDVGSKTELYAVMQGLAREGAGVIFISSDLDEIIGVCDRALVFREGRLVATMTREELSEEAILSCCYGGNQA